MDLLLLSTPVYFGDVTSQLKGFIDRLISFAKPDYLTNPDPFRLPKGKHLVWIQTQNAEKDKHTDIFERYSWYFKLNGFINPIKILAYDQVQPEEIESKLEFTDQVDQAIKTVFSKD